jgi:hypothetical protein
VLRSSERPLLLAEGGPSSHGAVTSSDPERDRAEKAVLCVPSRSSLYIVASS